MAQQQKIITVFGGTGFVGRHAVYALARTGAQIRVASRAAARAYFLRPAGDVGQIVPVTCDVQDDASVAAVLRGATHAVNLVGALYEKGRRNTFDRLHKDVPARIARICAQEGLQMLVHVSSLGASPYGTSKYSRSKAAGEDAVLRAFPKSVILRPSVIFGPEDNFFNRFAAMARYSPFLPLVAGGRTKFQPVYVGDVADAIRRIIDSPCPQKHLGLTYELGGPEVLSFRALIERMQRMTGWDRHLLSLPAPVAKGVGLLSAVLPAPLLTVDQVNNLKSDNVLSGNYPGLADLGLRPTALAAVLPNYLVQYKKTG